MRCGDLDDPRNGDVTVGGTRVGAKAVYRCDSGFKLRGDSVRQCQSNGRWSGNEPTCESISTRRDALKFTICI